MGNVHKGQLSMMIFVLGIIFFIMLGIFLFTSSIKPANKDYVNMYVHNLLLSSLRTTTGYGHPCVSVSDTLSCAYLTPNLLCGQKTCSEIAPEVTGEVIESVIRDNYDYYLVVEPENWETIGGETIKIGNAAVEKRVPHYAANEKILAYGSNLRIKLLIARK